MVTTTDYGYLIIAINDPVDQDLWGDYGNTNTNITKSIASKVFNGFVGTSIDANMTQGGIWSNNTTATSTFLNYRGNGTDIAMVKLDTTNNTAFPKHSGALVYLNSNATVANNTASAVNWNNEDYDTSSIWASSPNPSRLTVPAGVTRVRLTAQLRWAANTSGYRQIYIAKNGATFIGFPSVTESPITNQMIQNISSGVISVTAGDYFELYAFQTSGSSLNIEPSTNATWFSMECVE